MEHANCQIGVTCQGPTSFCPQAAMRPAHWWPSFLPTGGHGFAHRRWVWGRCCRSGGDGCVVEEVCDGDWFLAVRAGAAKADPAGEGVAVGAALFAQESFTAVGAFVDGDLPAGPGGRGGGPICLLVYPGDAVFLTNGTQGVLLPSSSDPLRVAGRTQLARSDAIWGAASGKVDHVQLQDSARPNGIAVTLSPVGTQVRVFVAPVSAGSVTITAFGPDGTVLQVVKQG